MKAWQEDQLETLSTLQDEQALFSFFLKLSQDLGFDFCAYGLRLPLPLSNPKTLMFNNYPAEWQNQYQAQNYLAVDPTVELAMRSMSPIIWTDDLFKSSLALWEDAKGHDLCVGWGQAIHDANGSVGLLTLSRSSELITQSELCAKQFQFAWLAQMIHFHMSQAVLPKLVPESNAKLSKREIEVIRWAADGKTSSEIASILNVSERTVNFHIYNVMNKLNATNKTSAVIKAAVLGFL